MNEKHDHKNRKIIRLKNWDYRWEGSYFITICTKDKKHYFGKIINKEIKISKIGVIADILWHEIKNRAKNVELGAFVVMPNHIHGILTLRGDGSGVDNTDGDTASGLISYPDAHILSEDRTGNILSEDRTGNILSEDRTGNILSEDRTGNILSEDRTGHILSEDRTGHALSLPPPPHPQLSVGQRRFQNIGKNSISSIIGNYKSAVTKHAHRLGFEFAWQTRFYDRIVRDERVYHTISEYIVNNPKKWGEDRFYSE
jgi:REP element-mobilizing transposase RayT